MESGLSEKLSIAVVGLGRIGWQFHFKQTLESDVYDLVAVVDPLEERVDEAKSASGCRGYASYDEMLASETPDVVALATPTVLHEPQTLIALERGCHVILEKPMTTSIESADRMIEAAANAERSATDRYMTLFMADKVGPNFMGKISGVTKFGLFVSLTETHAEGLIPIRILGQQLGERVRYDSFKQILTAKRARMNFKLGDEISVRIEDANKITSALTFSLSELEKPRTTYQKAKSYRRRRPGR